VKKGVGVRASRLIIIWEHGVTRHHCGLQLGMITRGSSETVMNNWSDDLRRDPPIWVQIPVLPLM